MSGRDVERNSLVWGGPWAPFGSRALCLVNSTILCALSFLSRCHSSRRPGMSSAVVPSGRTTPSAHPSSMACAAPWPMSGGPYCQRACGRAFRGSSRRVLDSRGKNGCAASPMSTARSLIRLSWSSMSRRSHTLTASSGVLSNKRRTEGAKLWKWSKSCFLVALWS